MRSKQMLKAVLMLVVLGLGGFALPYWAAAHPGHGDDGKIKGIAAGVPGGSISLNATGNSTTEFQVTFGSPSIAFPVILTPTTVVRIDNGAFPATLSNGDAVEVEGVLNAEVKLVLGKLELEDFLELEIDAFVVSIPGNTLQLPLAPGSFPVTIQISLAGSTSLFPIVITTETQAEEGAFLLTEGARVEFEALFRNGEIQVHKIELEDETEDEAEDE